MVILHMTNVSYRNSLNPLATVDCYRGLDQLVYRALDVIDGVGVRVRFL